MTDEDKIKALKDIETDLIQRLLSQRDPIRAFMLMEHLFKVKIALLEFKHPWCAR